MSEYNYANFPLNMDGDDFVRFPEFLKVGERAPDGELTDAGTGERVRLSALWKPGPAVIEFGSIS